LKDSKKRREVVLPLWPWDWNREQKGGNKKKKKRREKSTLAAKPVSEKREKVRVTLPSPVSQEFWLKREKKRGG